MLEHFVQDGLKVVFFILSDSYGLNDPRNKIINLIVKAVQEDKPLKMSGGEQYIDLIHINDIIEAVFAAIAMCCSLYGCLGSPEGVEPVKGCELDRYLGRWY